MYRLLIIINVRGLRFLSLFRPPRSGSLLCFLRVVPLAVIHQAGCFLAFLLLHFPLGCAITAICSRAPSLDVILYFQLVIVVAAVVVEPSPSSFAASSFFVASLLAFVMEILFVLVAS